MRKLLAAIIMAARATVVDAGGRQADPYKWCAVYGGERWRRHQLRLCHASSSAARPSPAWAAFASQTSSIPAPPSGRPSARAPRSCPRD